ncbi:MAG: hypothetical protein K9K33_18290 [Desulfarculaceae bacterium]|nr:hypothetical protein [Desulfarculaceae bacterium]
MDQTGLNRVFIVGLGDSIESYSSFTQKPIELDLKAPLPPKIRLYLYNVTHPPGGRTTGEHKIQLIVPGQTRGARADFDYTEGRMVILGGYEHELDVFVFWDAGLYRQFSYSRNVQVKAETVYAAFSGKVEMQARHLWNNHDEIVIAAPSERLKDALLLRAKCSLERLTEGA